MRHLCPSCLTSHDQIKSQIKHSSDIVWGDHDGILKFEKKQSARERVATIITRPTNILPTSDVYKYHQNKSAYQSTGLPVEYEY
jgi:hypothetical protein